MGVKDPTSAFRISSADVRDAFVVSAMTLPEGMEWLDKAVETGVLTPRFQMRYDADMARDLARQINDYVIEQGGVTPVSLALAAVLVSSSPVYAFRLAHAEGNRTVHRRMNQSLAIRSAYTLINRMALRSGLTSAPLPLNPFIALLSPDSPFLVNLADFVASQLVHDDPVPVIAVLTPLSQLTDVEQKKLLVVASAIRGAIPSGEAQVLIPGEGLKPSSVIDSTPSGLYGSEREILLHASVVIVVAAEHDSWGAAHSIAWCETNGADVVVFMDDPKKLSRVLGSRPYGTEVRPEQDAVHIARFVADRFEDRQDSYREHAADIAKTAQRVRGVLNRLKELTETTIKVGKFPRLTPERRDAALSSPWELDALTGREIRALVREMGEEGAELVSELLGLPASRSHDEMRTGQFDARTREDRAD